MDCHRILATAHELSVRFRILKLQQKLVMLFHDFGIFVKKRSIFSAGENQSVILLAI